MAAYLIGSFTLTWSILFPLTLNGLPPEPGLIAVVLFAQLGMACLVTAAGGGRAAVRELLSRTFRWRVSPLWYAVAVLALPAGILLAAVAVRGSAAVESLAPGLFGSYLLALTIVPLINLWEETGWMGFVQARLERSRGPGRAAVISGLLFAGLHLPLYIDPESPGRGLLQTVIVAVGIGVPIRIVFGWLYHRSGASVLIVALAHAGFNAANDGPLTLALWPQAPDTRVAPVAVLVAATLILAGTRGRLGANRERTAEVAR